jgi:hypothetical protein
MGHRLRMRGRQRGGRRLTWRRCRGGCGRWSGGTRSAWGLTHLAGFRWPGPAWSHDWSHTWQQKPPPDGSCQHCRTALTCCFLISWHLAVVTGSSVSGFESLAPPQLTHRLTPHRGCCLAAGQQRPSFAVLLLVLQLRHPGLVGLVLIVLPERFSRRPGGRRCAVASLALTRWPLPRSLVPAGKTDSTKKGQ